MSLIELTDGSHRLFDPTHADPFPAQDGEDVLYRTSYNNYVMFTAPDRWGVIAPEDAYVFLGLNGYQAAIPTTPEGEFTTVSPRTVFSTRLPGDLTAKVKAVASMRRVSVQDAVEEALKLWLKTV